MKDLPVPLIPIWKKINQIFHLLRHFGEQEILEEPGDLAGLCAVGSFINFCALQHMKCFSCHFISEVFVVENQNHCYNVVDCSQHGIWLVDVTSTQFGLSKDFLFEKISSVTKCISEEIECGRFSYCYDIQTIHNDLFGFRHNLYKYEWPQSQNPFIVLSDLSEEHKLCISKVVGCDIDWWIGQCCKEHTKPLQDVA
jgi:hypothetical protein